MKKKNEMRIKILNVIFESFQGITQWIPHEMDNAYKNSQQAECLIELLEIEDCGNIGGFDDNNELINITDYKLYDRFLTLVRKYNNENDIKEVCYFNIESLGEYFKKIINTRETFNND